MNATKQRNRHYMLSALEALGIHYDEAQKLRRISMTLQRWFELECGTENEQGTSFSIQRDDNTDLPRMRTAFYSPIEKKYKEYFSIIPDREKGARKRLAAIMTKYPHLIAYVQGDPRGCALYVLHKDMIEPGQNIDSVYTKGIAVF